MACLKTGMSGLLGAVADKVSEERAWKQGDIYKVEI